MLENWLARQDLNLEPPDPESGALPLSHAPANGRQDTPTGPESGYTRAIVRTLRLSDRVHAASTADRTRGTHLTRRSLVLVIFIVVFVAACSAAAAKPSATPTNSPAALVTAPPTVAPTVTVTPDPTVAPPTKKPKKKRKKPKPTPTPAPTPVTWQPAYTARVCAAVGYLSDTKPHLDTANALIGAQNYPRARSEVFEIVSLAVKATDEIAAAPEWGPGAELISWLNASASSLGKGGGRLIDGMAALDTAVMQAGTAEMNTGGVQLAQARAAIDGLSATYGPAGC